MLKLTTIAAALLIATPALAHFDPPVTSKFPIFKETWNDKTFTGEVWHYANCAEGDGFYEFAKHRWRDARPNDPECPRDKLPGDK
jgi:hypothetical protein